MHVHTAGSEKTPCTSILFVVKDTLHVHTVCGEKAPLHVHTACGEKTPCTSILLMDVHTASGGQEYTLHVHTRLLLVLNLLYHVDKVNAGMPREKGSPALAFYRYSQLRHSGFCLPDLSVSLSFLCVVVIQDFPRLLKEEGGIGALTN
jgi:hypothetical protein